MTFSTVKVSDLPPINLGTLDGQDHLIINDNEGTTKSTNIIELGELIGYVEAQDLTFTGDITFENDTYFGGSILPKPGDELTIEVDYLNIRQELNVEDFVKVTGLELNDLEDVDYDTASIQQGQALLWDSVNKVFVNRNVDTEPVYFDRPITPAEGDLWWRKDNGRLYIYYKSTLSGFSQWVQASGSYIYL